MKTVVRIWTRVRTTTMKPVNVLKIWKTRVRTTTIKIAVKINNFRWSWSRHKINLHESCIIT